MDTNKRAKVLIVEDETIIAWTIRKHLEDSGYDVIGVVNSGERAIEMTLAARPDLVLMDIQLRGQLDGVHTAQRIQTQLDIPVVYLTAHSDQETLKRVLHSDSYGFITKPFTRQELHQIVHNALHRHQMKRSKSRDE